MKSVCKLLSLVGLFLITAIWTSGDTPAMPDAKASAPVEVNLSLVTPSVIEAGEPIVLRYTMANLLEDQTIAAYTGMYKTAWYSVSLKGGKGQPMMTLRDEQPINSGGLHPSEMSTLAPQQHEDGYIAVSRLLPKLHAGKYVLTIRADVQYTTVTPTEHNSAVLKHAAEADGARFTKEYVFPLTLLPADSLHLTLKAEALGRDIQTEQEDSKLHALLDSLFSMPEAQAAPSWTALVNNPRRMYQESIADELARLHTVKAVDLLVQMLEQPSLPPDNAFYIKTKIDESYNAGDVTVKGHVKALASSRGGTMPAKVVLPQAGD